MRAYFTYSWDVIYAYHICMFFINESTNLLQLRMQDPQAPRDPMPVQGKFISYLQWHANMPFCLDFRGGDTSGGGAGNKQVESTNEDQNEKEDEVKVEDI